MIFKRTQRPRRGMLICLVGTDGSGKTTLARLVSESVRSRGEDIRYVHGVLPFSPLLKPIREFARLLFMKGTDVNSDYEQYHTKMVSASRRHRRLSILYAFVWFVSYCLEAFRPITLAVRSGKIVLADRYIYDILLRIALGIDRPVESLSPLASIFFLLNARPDFVFLVDTPEEVAFHRKSDIHSIEYLRDRRTRYLKLAERYGFYRLDGLQTPEVLLDQVLTRCFGSGVSQSEMEPSGRPS